MTTIPTKTTVVNRDLTPIDLELDAVFKRLNLANARRVWRDLVARAEREEWAYDRFLTVLVAEEIAHRQQTRLTRLSRRARGRCPGDDPERHRAGRRQRHRGVARGRGAALWREAVAQRAAELVRERAV
jgi:hypothetical protein